MAKSRLVRLRSKLPHGPQNVAKRRLGRSPLKKRHPCTHQRHCHTRLRHAPPPPAGALTPMLCLHVQLAIVIEEMRKVAESWKGTDASDLIEFDLTFDLDTQVGSLDTNELQKLLRRTHRARGGHAILGNLRKHLRCFTLHCFTLHCPALPAYTALRCFTLHCAMPCPLHSHVKGRRNLPRSATQSKSFM